MEHRMTNKKSCSFDVSAGTSSTRSLDFCDISKATVSSRGRVRLPRLKYWQGERASLFEDTLVVQASPLAVPQKVILADNSQTASELSSFENSNHLNDINCNICAVKSEDEPSNVLKSKKTKTKIMITEKTRKKRVPKNSDYGFCNLSSGKKNVSKNNKSESQMSQRNPVVLLEKFSFDDIDKKEIKSGRKKSSSKSVSGNFKAENTISNLKTKYKDVIKDVCVTLISIGEKQNHSKTPPCSTGKRFTKDVSVKKTVENTAINKRTNVTRFSKLPKVSANNSEADVSARKKKNIKEAKNKAIRNSICKKSLETKVSNELNVTFSSKGRARLPRLEYWRGERISTVGDCTFYEPESKTSAKLQRIDNFNCQVILERNVVDNVKNNVSQKSLNRYKVNGKVSDSNRKQNVGLESMAWKSRYKKSKKKRDKSKCKASPQKTNSILENLRLSQRDDSAPIKKRKLFSQADVDTSGLNDGSESATFHSCFTEISEPCVKSSIANEACSVRSTGEKLKEKCINEILQKIGPSSSSLHEDVKRNSQSSGYISPFIMDRTSLWVENIFSQTSVGRSETRPSTSSNSTKRSFDDRQKRLSAVDEEDGGSKSTTADRYVMEVNSNASVASDVMDVDGSGRIVQIVGEQQTANNAESQSDSEFIVLNIDSSDSEPTRNVSSDELRSVPVSLIRESDRRDDCSGRFVGFRYIDDCGSDFDSSDVIE